MALPRVALHVISPAEARRIVDRRPLADDRWHPEYPLVDELDVVRQLADDPAPHAVFGPMMIRTLDDGLAVGGIGFFGPPDATGSVEIGYGLVPAVRGLGIVSAALAELLAIAAAEGVRRVTAETDRANRASSRVLERAGFRELTSDHGQRRFELLLRST
jgi:RimJ/RimL family protein N-acetyltransferase